ncbi:Proline iminopeptidase [Talaromyces pinophilus]|nr:Proline iminopeptidase [Talaromyces pinophilus]
MVEFLTVNGATLAYAITGPTSAPLMITLHGGRGMGTQLSSLLRVLSFDYRGHGQSSRTKPYSFEQLVDDIEGVRQHFLAADEQVIICGGSFGGFLAQQYAIKYASKVSHLILRGTAASHHHEEGAIKTMETRLHKAPNFSAQMLRNKVFGAYEDDDEFKLIYFAMMPLYTETYNPDAALRACRGMVFVAESHNDLYSEEEKYFDYKEKLGSITAKTLVIVGEKDWICPPDNSRIIVDGIPGAELLIVPDANHSVHIEKPEIVLKRIRDFLKH